MSVNHMTLILPYQGAVLSFKFFMVLSLPVPNPDTDKRKSKDF